MKIPFYSALIFFGLLLFPVIAQAGVTGYELTNVLGCYGSAFGQTCQYEEGKFFSTIACRVMKTIDAAIIPMYCNITQNPSYLMFLDALLSLYVVIFGFSYVAGISRARLGEVIVAILKVTVIYGLLTNAGFFFSFMYQTLVDTPQELISTALSVNGSNAQNIFEHIDQGMYKVFNEVSRPDLPEDDRRSYIAKELAIVGIALGVKTLVPGGGWIYGLFMFVVMGWLFSYLMIVVRYLLTYMSIIYLLMLTPIFLPSILFKKTFFLWEEWQRMMVAFLLEIIIVVAFVLMIEQFYVEFYDVLKKSFENLKLDVGETSYLKTYSDGANEVVKQETIPSINNAKESLNTAGFEGDASQISADFLVQIISMAVIIFLCSVFLRYIPTFASLIAGQYNFSKMFGGMQFNQKGGVSRTNLFGQEGGAVKKDATSPDADKPGGIMSDFISAINPFS